MTNRELKREVSRFLKLHKLNGITYSSLRAAIEKQGYTVIPFNNLANDRHVDQLVCALKLEELVSNAKGFTYTDQHQRLIFIHEGLADVEKTVVLAHEIGHIVLGHFSSAPIIGKDVQDEYDANEFAHYLLNPGAWKKTCTWCRRHRIMFCSSIIALVLLVAVGAFVLISAVEPAAGDFYVTESGEKFHEKKCMLIKQRSGLRRLTQEELESGAYDPCQVCLP